MKQKFISLALAVMLLLGVTGCAMSTPASVGSVGGVDIPAGIYLLAQYNAYNTASGAAKLATGETASNVKAVLKAECTGTINGEEVTTDGADYVARLTLRSLQYYAAVEKKFDELGGTLDEAATAEAAKTADTQWENNSDLYAANGISKATLEKYQLNSKKADACLKLIYGENGSNPVTEQEYADYINNDCYYLELVQLPLFDQSTYTFASDDQKAEIEALANQCRDDLAAATNESALYSAAMTYVPQAFTALGFTEEKARESFGFLMDAYKFGAPPHGGMAYGLDRMVMLMLKKDSIRDVIAFPKVQNAGEPMSGAPDIVDPQQLKDLSIALTLTE